MTSSDGNNMSLVKPTPRQLEYQDWELGIFLHFGIRTFYEGHRDWDGRKMEPAAFDPGQLDCRQWASIARQAGARYMVLTAKHHDGFANWPSKYTDFSVANSPWRGGKGDVVRDYVDACRLHGLKVGLYYSPADWSSPVYEDERAYDDYFINQISEILTGYGQIDMLWFDGCGSENHTYDWKRIVAEIRRMQPDILIFNMGDPDYRWVGNESGLAPLPCWNTVDQLAISERTDALTPMTTQRWLPAECDCLIRDRNWFYQDSDVDTVKSPEELLGMYYYSVGRGANLLLNIGPDRRGLLPDRDADHLLAMGRELKRRFDTPLATTGQFEFTGTEWRCRFESHMCIDHVVLQEDLTDGESVRAFVIEVESYKGSQRIAVHEGRNIGHKAICVFPPVRTRKVFVRVTESSGPVTMRAMSIHRAHT